MDNHHPAVFQSGGDPFTHHHGSTGGTRRK
jgi:hypothetical protein